MADPDKEPEEKPVTRKDLAEELARSRELNTALLQRLERLEARTDPVRAVARPDPVLVPYAGLVQATADCCIERRRSGPLYEDGKVKIPGEVFWATFTALWTDDPFVAVSEAGTRDDGSPKYIANPDAPVPIDFRFRKVLSAAEDPTPRRASEY